MTAPPEGGPAARDGALDCATLVETEAALAEAVLKLEKAPTVGLDCEGKMMSRFGSLVMVQVATPEHVYIVDIPAVGAEVVGRLLKPVMEAAKPTKLMWDSRTDTDVLYHFLGITLKGVLDLQIAEALASARTFNVYLKDKVGKQRMPCVTGLQRTLREYSEKCPKVKKFLSYKEGVAVVDVDWDVRPFPEAVLKYAVADVLGLFALVGHLVPGYPRVPKDVLQASQRYSAVLRTNPMMTEHAYTNYNSSFIPLGVIEPLPQVAMRESVSCTGCLRDFHYSKIITSHCAACANQCFICAEVTHRRLYRPKLNRAQQGSATSLSPSTTPPFTPPSVAASGPYNYAPFPS